jgi:hypothetical protein
MFGGPKIKLDRTVYERAKQVADIAGYATVEEFVTHIVERELQNFDDAQSDEDIKKKLQGLGYIS